MKKTVMLLLMLVVLLPSHAFATTVSTSYIEKMYFEAYKDRVKEVRDAQSNLSKVLGTEVVKTLTEKLKVSTANYNSAVKSKASKESIEAAKNTKEQDKKALTAAKLALAADIKAARLESDAGLKEIAAYKAETVKMIKTHLEGKDKLTENAFSKAVHDRLTYINSRFDEILHSLKNA